jgi:histone chaperone ASF1
VVIFSPDLEWKLVYVGSAESEKHDQVLDVIEVGPVVRGQYKFIFEVCTFPVVR